MEYAFRKSAFEKEKTYVLTKDGIEVSDPDGPKTVYKYADIEQVNTSFAASKNNSFYQCRLKLTNGLSLSLKSQHYRGIADFEDRDEAYSTFVTRLHKLLAVSNPHVVYKKGIGMIGYIASMLVFTIAGLLLPIGSIAALITGSILYGVIGVIASILLILRMVKYTRKNKPGKYSPDNIPKTLLPSH